CQRFEFRRIKIDDSRERLLEIAEKEKMSLDEGAAALISRVSEGGMRDALSLLDQCFSVSSHVTEETVRECAGISGTEHLFRIADAVLRKDAAEALTTLRELIDRSKSPSRLIEELIAHYRALMLLKAGADPGVLRATAEELSRYARQNESYTLEMLLRALSILSEALSGMSRTRNEELSCEMCLIRLCTPKLDTDEKALSGRIDALEKLVLDTLKTGVPAGQGVPPPAPIKSESLAPVPGFFPEESPRDNLPPQEYFPTEEEPAQPAPAPKEKEAPPIEEEKVAMAIDLPFDLDPPPEPVAEPYAEPYPEPPAATYAEPFAAEPEKPIAVPESADGFAPFAEWKTILESLPFSIRILVRDTTALLGGNNVLVCGSELQKGYAAGEFSGELSKAV
ncbi:MAG: hypothetical protein K2N29_01305, partial [Ruminiclostridium sp.]|nr:hypothetical protein [Ruminiclostridium sp.]